MAGEMTIKEINRLRKEFSTDKDARIIQNAVTQTTVQEIALSREVVTSTDFTFSTKIDEWKVTNQKASGRCWLFAVLNLMRPGAMEKMNVKEFEFSQAYVHFWDKFERANHNLEAMIVTSDRDLDDRTIGFILDNPSEDGGQWNMAINVINKHGMVPKSAYPESQSSSSTRWMNANLRLLVRSIASEIRSMIDDGSSKAQARAHKKKRMKDVWRLLCIHLGTPPTEFEWSWRDKDNEHHTRGTMTPHEFLEEFVTIDYNDYVCLVNDPRNDLMQTYTVDFLQNVVGGPPVEYLNISIEEMKTVTRKLLEDGTTVWMGCDVGKHMHRKLGIWDAKLFEFEEMYGIEFGLDKKDRLDYHHSLMTHAMLFTGVDADKNGIRKWRVENSWGAKNSGEDGYYTMNDSWFDQYMFEIAAPKSYLTAAMRKALDTKPVVLPAWDPMGSLACSNCGSDDENR
uniref:Aminopeptidase n=1 Tax=uncultured marine group II/III euryarchaeote KM3_74_A11 TaxID=1456500 RepID=A0A075HKE0_9EURY|nr:Bleomycin hydrolase (pepC) [uncultured marine group II/III euryarchaeote KM3_74_A11]